MLERASSAAVACCARTVARHIAQMRLGGAKDNIQQNLQCRKPTFGTPTCMELGNTLVSIHFPVQMCDTGVKRKDSDWIWTTLSS